MWKRLFGKGNGHTLDRPADPRGGLQSRPEEAG
jgi:hypothetical protein